MSAKQKTVEKLSKGDQRRRHLIEAAAECFRRECFQGASMARISKASGMSPGHISHYFPKKECIVEAIVDQEENDLVALLRALEENRGSMDFLAILLSQTDEMIERSMATDHVALMLEIAAEASRNPKIAEMLCESEKRIADQVVDFAERLDGKSAACVSREPSTRDKLEILTILLSGLSVRSVANPSLDRSNVAIYLREIIQHLWTT